MTAMLGSLLLLAASHAAPADPAAVTVTYTPCGGMICIPVRLADGRNHVLLLDTGNVNSWLMAETARALGLKLDPIEQDGKALAGRARADR